MIHKSVVEPELPVLRPFGFVGQFYPPASSSADDILMTLLPASEDAVSSIELMTKGK